MALIKTLNGYEICDQKARDDIISHKHSTGDITSGVLPIARGGTGATTNAGARATLDVPSSIRVNGHFGLGLPDGTDTDWMRSTRNGLIGWYAGTSSLGTSSWPWNALYTNRVFINNNIVNDFIVSRGTSGGWTFEKYYSGYCVIYRFSKVSMNIDTAYSSIWYGRYQFAFPFALNSIVNVQAIAGDCYGIVNTMYGYSRNNMIDIIVSEYTKRTSHSIYLNIKIIGKWK